MAKGVLGLTSQAPYRVRDHLAIGHEFELDVLYASRVYTNGQ